MMADNTKTINAPSDVYALMSFLDSLPDNKSVSLSYRQEPGERNELPHTRITASWRD